MTSLQMLKILAGAVGLVVYVLSEMAKAKRAADASAIATPTAPQRPALSGAHGTCNGCAHREWCAPRAQKQKRAAREAHKRRTSCAQYAQDD